MEAGNPVFRDRVSRGMTRAEYAEFLGYAKIQSGIAAIARWEKSGVPENSAKALSRLSAATGRPAAFFARRREDVVGPEFLAAILREVDSRIAAAGIEDRRSAPYGRRATDQVREMVA